MIRFAKKEDAHEIAPLILVILNDMELPFLQKYGTTKTLEILEEAITDPTYRYCYTRGIVEELDGKVAGVAYGYTDADEPFIDKPLKKSSKNMGSKRQNNSLSIKKHFPMNGT